MLTVVAAAPRPDDQARSDPLALPVSAAALSRCEVKALVDDELAAAIALMGYFLQLFGRAENTSLN
jgi:hypothetical protein